MKVNEGLNQALSKGHEVLLTCTLDEKESYGYLAIPLSYEREVRNGRTGVTDLICRMMPDLAVCF